MRHERWPISISDGTEGERINCWVKALWCLNPERSMIRVVITLLVCLDLDECETYNGGCSVNANCINTPGSFYCICKTYFNGDGFNCDSDPPSGVCVCVWVCTYVHLLPHGIDVKNITLQIKKNIKTCFFHFYKNIKNMHKNIKLQYPFK